MAMPSGGNLVMPEKMHFPSGGVASGGGINNNVVFGGGAAGAGGGAGGDMLYRQQWYVDERDGLISWLRSEFAAANAIIDSMCHHLRAIGDPGEYDEVIGAIQHRRCNWNQVLLMQQFFSVSDVVNVLQQVAWRRQQRWHADLAGRAGGRGRGVKDFRTFRQGQQRFEAAREGFNSRIESNGHKVNVAVSAGGGGLERATRGVDKSDERKSCGKVGAMDENNSLESAEEKKVAVAKHQSDSILNSSGNSQGSLSNSESEAVGVNDGCISNSRGNDSYSTQNQDDIQNPSTAGKTFIGKEMFDGEMVNVVDGLKLYEDLFDSSEVSKLLSLVNDLRVSGKRGQFHGTQTYVVSKRPMRGRGREIIQLGVPVIDSPSDLEHLAISSKDKNVESIPSLFQDVIERMAASQVMTVKPNACVVDFYNEGDHSQPYNWPSWYGRPIYMLFLTECDLTFGRLIVSEHPGDYRGALKLSLGPGSFLVMQGKSTDFSKYSIPSIRKQRILVTFTKLQPKKSLPIDTQRLASPATSHWAPPTSRSANHIRHQVGHKHYATLPTTGVLPAQSTCPQIPPPNALQPLFVSTPVAPPMPYTAPVPAPAGSTGWTAATPRHPPPRFVVPGTGVFLPPPGSGNSSQQLPGSLTEVNPSAETPTLPENANSNNNHTSSSPNGKIDGKMDRQECNGNVDGTEVEKVAEKEEENSD